MAVTKVTEFEEYKITNAHIALFDESTGQLGEMKPLGCVGTLTVEPETSTIQKKCSGEVVKEVTKTTKLNCTAEAHVAPSVAIDVLGLTKDGLKEGVYGYAGKKTARGVIVLDVLDMYEEQKRLMAFPNVSFTNGFFLDIESGAEEIKQMEMSFTGMRDKNEYFYYQAYAKDIEGVEGLMDNWHKNFTPELVSAAPVVPGV